MINTRCGFDPKFFELLKRHFEQRSDFERHGLLLFDEMSIRESVAVCSRTLTYTGLTDFGEEGPKATDVSEKATHGLVFMFQPLTARYTQPIGVFASKGTVKATVLLPVQLAIKALTLLEQAGAKIHGFVADGAQTNRKLWTLLGINGKRQNMSNSFEHPLDGDRRVFAFSDTPHLIKNIRNRLYNERELRVSCDENGSVVPLIVHYNYSYRTILIFTGPPTSGANQVGTL